MVWSFGALAVLMRRFAGWSARTAVFMLLMVACTAFSIWQLEQRIWQEDYSEQRLLDATKPHLRPSQQAFKAQQALWQTKIDTLAPERKGITDVYGLVFAPYASEDVFKREAALVNSVLDERFDAKGRVLQLLNHGATLQTHLWATPHNIVRAIEALTSKMEIDADKDDGFSNPQISVGASVKPLLDALEARLGRTPLPARSATPAIPAAN